MRAESDRQLPIERGLSHRRITLVALLVVRVLRSTWVGLVLLALALFLPKDCGR
ncbi:MAG TPA: hypothetical protein VES65_11400 [Solirubrobacteraceae bacterium]|nr:hypothetical protein [Solirubrobacteraceae bacterium]